MNINHSILLFLLFICSNHLITSQQFETSSNPTSFIQKSCNSTLYPTLCIKCFSTYANSIKPPNQEQKLAQIALQVSISRARSVSKFVSNISSLTASSTREYQALKDCCDLLGSSVDQLRRSLKELNELCQSSVALNPNNPDFSWHMSNVRTWVSAALTNDVTCVDGFSDQKYSNIHRNITKDYINAKVRGVSHVTSIALAFITHFAQGY